MTCPDCGKPLRLMWPTPGAGDGVKSYMNRSIMQRVEKRAAGEQLKRSDGGEYQESLPERVERLRLTGDPEVCECSPSEASSRVSEGSTSASSVRVCELCGSASRTGTGDGSLPATGPESPSMTMCRPLWPTPGAGDGVKSYMNRSIMRRVEERAETGSRHLTRKDGGTYHESLGERVALEEMTGSCPCVCHLSMSSAAASPAKTFPLPAEASGSGGHVRVFGGSSQGSLGNYDPATCSLRTSQLSLLEGSMSSLRILPRAGSMRNGIVYRRRPLAPLTGGTGSGLLPTPTRTANQLAPSMRKHPTGEALHRSVERETWPTPTKRDYKDAGDNVDFDKVAARSKLAGVVQVRERWRTPQARDGTPRGPSDPRVREAQGHSVSLHDQIGGSLNPEWVEWLMGYPPGWTALPPSETP